MIKLVNALPETSKPTAEYIRIKCLFDCYKEDPDVYFWQQTGEETYISLSDGNMTLSYGGGNTAELAEFIKMLNPKRFLPKVRRLKIWEYSLTKR